MLSGQSTNRVNVDFFYVQCEHAVTLFGKLWHSLPISSINMTTCPLLVCVHPWSKLGGSSENMYRIARVAAARGVPAVTFDHRGIGQSTGRSTFQGMDEVEDVIAICRYAVFTLGAKNIVLVGSSAGAPIAGSALDKVEEVKMYVAIGYVFGCITRIIFGRHYETVLQSQKPKLFIQGSQDGFTYVDTLNSYLERSLGPTEKLIFPNVGHFALEDPSYADELVDAILQFVSKFQT